MLTEPVGVADLLATEPPEEKWLVEGLMPCDANTLLVGYPKSMKTMFLLDAAVSIASGTKFLGRFPVSTRRRVGMILMEDRDWRIRRRIERLCKARGIAPSSLDGMLYWWFAPPLRLTKQAATALGAYADELELDLLAVDSWSYIAIGDSNSSDSVTPQLQALSAVRAKRDGLSVLLTHHARKVPTEGDALATRITDSARNSSAFGAWYDTGILLSRPDERSPVDVRVEHRDQHAPLPFAFEATDEEPARLENDFAAQGALWLRAADKAVLDCAKRVEAYVSVHPGVIKRTLRAEVPGDSRTIDAAVDLLVERDRIRITESGNSRKHYPTR